MPNKKPDALDTEEHDRDAPAAPADDIPSLDDELLEDPLHADWSGEPPPDPERVAVVGERLVLPWRTRVTLLDRGLTLPAVLDPTRETSTWIVAEHRPESRARARLRLGDLEIEVELAVKQGTDPGLRLGRDVLGDRVLVSSAPLES